MVNGRIILVLSSVVTMAGFALPQAAVASAKHVDRDQIQVSLAVPDYRVIVLDASGQIEQVFSNTEKAVTPKVATGSFTGASAPLTPELEAQYNELMDQISDNHVVSVRAKKAPLSVDYPNFASLNTNRTFVVTPSRITADEDAIPYEITLDK